MAIDLGRDRCQEVFWRLDASTRSRGDQGLFPTLMSLTTNVCHRIRLESRSASSFGHSRGASLRCYLYQLALRVDTPPLSRMNPRQSHGHFSASVVTMTAVQSNLTVYYWTGNLEVVLARLPNSMPSPATGNTIYVYNLLYHPRMSRLTAPAPSESSIIPNPRSHEIADGPGYGLLAQG